MTIDMVNLGGVLLLAAIAAYMQTLTGFGLGLIFMGGIGLTGLLSLNDAAVLVSVMMVVNAAQVLFRGWRDIARPQFLAISIASIVCLLIGYWVLGLLLSASLIWLKLVLGSIIILSSLQLLMKPHPYETISGKASFVFFGAIAGLMGGLFSTSGPPLVFHLYRQPMRPAVIRETLVAVFALNASLRLITVASLGHLPSGHFWWNLLAIPVVMLFTFLAKRWPPPLSQATMRRLAFMLLFLSGVSLGAPTLFTLFGDV